MMLVAHSPGRLSHFHKLAQKNFLISRIYARKFLLKAWMPHFLK